MSARADRYGAAAATLRLFFALDPDAGVRARIAEIAREIAVEARGRAVAEANLHLTVAFLGEVAATSVPELCAIGDALPRRPCTLALDRVGGFRGSGVAWLAASRVPDALPALRRALVDGLAAGGFAPDPKPFRAHVTLARKCAGTPRRTVDPPVVWEARSLALVASTLAPGGSVYRALATWSLDDTNAIAAA